MTRFPRLLAAVAFMAIATPLSARAQGVIGADSSEGVAAVAPVLAEVQVAPVAAGPTLASATVALRTGAAQPVAVVRASATESAVPNALPAARTSSRSATTLMIVGGAAFIAGAIMGDTPGAIFMVGGAAVGIYGLYQYLQ